MSEPKPEFKTLCHVIEPGKVHPCGHHIATTRWLPAQLIGNDQEPKARDFVTAIMKHMRKAHPSLMQHSAALAAQYLGFLMVGSCQSEDPGVHDFYNQFAGLLAVQTALPLSDDALAELTVKMGLTMEDPMRAKILEALTYVRDFMARRRTETILSFGRPAPVEAGTPK